jgi:universal stress protein A
MNADFDYDGFRLGLGRRRAVLRPKKILARIDFGEGSRNVLRCALEFARLHGSTIHLMYVVERAPFISGMNSSPLAITDREAVENARVELLSVMDQEENDGIHVTPYVRLGRPEKEIPAGAKEVGADLIILAEGRSNVLGRKWGRSTAEKVVRRASCPVLVLQTENVSSL